MGQLILINPCMCMDCMRRADEQLTWWHEENEAVEEAERIVEEGE